MEPNLANLTQDDIIVVITLAVGLCFVLAGLLGFIFLQIAKVYDKDSPLNRAIEIERRKYNRRVNKRLFEQERRQEEK